MTKKQKEFGASMIEMALMIALIAIISVGAARTLGARAGCAQLRAGYEVGGAGHGNWGGPANQYNQLRSEYCD